MVALHLLITTTISLSRILCSLGQVIRRSPWTALDFPQIGAPECSLGYHTSKAERYLCDPDQILGQTTAESLAGSIADWWKHCESSSTDEQQDRNNTNWSIGIAV